MDSGVRDRLIEVLVGFFLWLGNAYCFLSTLTFFFFQIILFSNLLGLSGFLPFILAVASVAIPYSGLCFLTMHKRELVELCQGQSRLAPIVPLLNNFAAYFTFQFLFVPVSMALIIVAGFFIPLILLVGTESVLVAPFTVCTALHKYISEKITRFNRLEGPRLQKVPPDAPFINRWLAKTDSWLELELYPPAQLSLPRYMTILPNESKEEPLLRNNDEQPLLPEEMTMSPGNEQLHLGISCQICGGPIDEAEEVRCARCDTPHHRDCWQWCGGCSIYGCGSQDIADN